MFYTNGEVKSHIGYKHKEETLSDQPELVKKPCENGSEDRCEVDNIGQNT